MKGNDMNILLIYTYIELFNSRKPFISIHLEIRKRYLTKYYY